jgi:hypothetical protein
MFSPIRPSSALLIGLGAASLVACDADRSADTPPRDDVDAATTIYVGTLEADRAERSASAAAGIDAAVSVRALAVDDISGGRRLIGTADLTSDGRFLLSTEAHDERRAFTLIEAVDARGEVVMANVVEEIGYRYDEVRHTRLDAETTLETLVWLNRSGLERNATYAQLADIRTWIDAETGLQAYQTMQTTDEGEQVLSLFTTATNAALAARLDSLEQAGWTGTGSTHYYLWVDASQDLQAAAFDGSLSRDDWESAYAFVDAALQSQGLTPQEIADAGNAAAIAYRATLYAHADTPTPLKRTALRSAMRNEAWATRLGLYAATGDEAVRDAADQLWNDIYDARTLDEATDAWIDLSVQLEASLFDMATLDAGGELIVSDLLEGNLSTAPDDDVAAAFDALIDATPTSPRTDRGGELAVDYWSDLRNNVRNQVSSTGVFADAQVNVATELTLHAIGHRD